MGDTKWISFFSQTGSEIADISEALGQAPDVIITNDRPDHLRTIDERIEKQGYFTWANKPSEEDYISLLEAYPDAIVTLHGWLRIVPPYVCERSKIYNGHPGLITKYPPEFNFISESKIWFNFCSIFSSINSGILPLYFFIFLAILTFVNLFVDNNNIVLHT